VTAGARRLVCASGGNAGLAVAHAGRRLGAAVRVIVPRSTSERARELLAAEGAEVVVHGDDWDAAHDFALAELPADATYIHPFDDREIWAGHAEIVVEAATQGERPGTVVVAVGGGGLLCGVLQGMHAVGWTDVPVVAVETEGAASYGAAVVAGEPVTIPAITSLATTLGARTVAAEAVVWSRVHEIVPWTVSDRAAVQACLRFADDHRVLVEPACGAALSVIYDRAPAIAWRGPALVIVCGGAGVSLALLRAWAERTGAA
jgi:L-serine/L-threonine ammonia-lyase